MESSQCAECARYMQGQTCEAYRDGVPFKIFSGEHDHTKSFRGDRGLRFLSLEDDTSTEQTKRVETTVLNERKKKAKSPVRKSIETLRDELQKLFPEQKVVIR